MNLHRIFKPVSAILLTIGLVAFGVAPADAATPHKAPAKSTFDTGWGFR